MPSQACGTLTLFVALLTFAGCSAGPRTRLELRGDGAPARRPATYAFEQTLWRDHPDGVEVVGHGLMPYRPDPFLPGTFKEQQAGPLVFRLHGVPRPGGRYAVEILGPSAAVGPGDDEILTGVAESVTVTTGEKDLRRIVLRDVPVRSRNKPDASFALSGVVVARPDDGPAFDSQLATFDAEKSYRGPAPRPPTTQSAAP